MLKILKKIIAIVLLFQIFNFGEVFFQAQNILRVPFATAQSPVLPIFTVYRDAGGGENITATAQSLSWDTLVSENTEIPIDGTNTKFDLSVGGHYLVMYSVPVRSTGGANRSEIQSWLQVNGSSDLPYSYSSSYIRREDDDFEGYNEGAAVVEVSAGDDIELQIQKTDSNTATIERTPNRSGINILKLDDAWNYARLRPSTAQAITTIWSDVTLGITDELDTATYSLSGTDITLKETGKYLVTYSVGTVTTGTDRTNNEIRLTLGGTEIEATRSTAYARAQNGSFTGIASYVGIIDSSSVNQILNLEIRRESSLAGTTNNTIPTKTGITITKLPDGADYLRVGEAIGGQDITVNPNTPVTFDTTIEQGVDLQHDAINTSEIDINSSGDYLFFHSVYNARTDTGNNNRENPYLEWQVSGVTVPYGVSGSYNRHSNDADGITNSSHSSAGVILKGLSSGDRVELTETNEASNGTSVYVGGRMGVQGVSLFSLFSGGAYLSQSQYRWRDDSNDFDTSAGWIAGENTNITNVEKNQNIRLRMKVENPTISPYVPATQFELQWGKTSGSCSAQLMWNSMDVPSDDWEMLDTVHISPNAETSSTQLLANISGNTHIRSEGYHAPSGETLVTPASTFVAYSQKEYEFSIQATEYAVSNLEYCFRLYNIAENKVLELNEYAKVQIGSTPVILDDIWGEAGKVNAPANGGWTTVSFAGGPYTSPVIVGRTNTYNDGNEALVFEARNVTSTSAQVRLCDSNASNATGCQNHIGETIGYIVVDASQTSSIDGIEAGTFSASQSFDTGPGLITTTYGETFSTTPYVFTSIQTTNGSSPIVTRVSNSTITNFTGGICQQAGGEDDCSATHPTETFGWIAIDPSMNPFYKDIDIGSGVSDANSFVWSTASFSTSFSTIPVGISQTVTNNGGQDVQIDEIQNVSLSGMEFRSCELDNDDDCDTHAVDDIRWFAIEEGVFASEYFLDKTHYRWYENNGTITPTVPLADESATLGTLPVNKELRLRMLVQNADPELPIGALALKLQYGSGAVCEGISSWTDVGAPGGGEDFLHFDNVSVADGATIPSSLLLGGGHNLQSYNESSPTVVNPNPIAIGEWGEWDFSIIDNTATAGIAYCFRVVTQNDDVIEYSSYAQIDTTDIVNPTITGFTPTSNFLFPIGNFDMTYSFTDAGSGIDVSSRVNALQKWNGVSWGGDIVGAYVSLDVITATGALYRVTGLPYGRYRAGFGIQDNSGNSTIQSHEFYVDEIEFLISTGSIDIGNIGMPSSVYTSSEELVVTVKTVGAAFDVTLLPNTDLTGSGGTIPIWDSVTGFGYQEAPYFGTILSHSGGVVVGSETASLNADGDKNTYTYNLRYGALLDVIENYAAGDYEGSVDFGIEIDY